MKPEAQRIAIAEACGWSEDRSNVSHPWRRGILNYVTIPDYLNDLNAMHEAEGVLTDGQWLIYEHALQHPHVMKDRDYSHRHIIHTTAAQRAEAFLRTIGKWEESYVT